MRHRPKNLRVGIVALPGVQMLDVAGPLDVFAEANLQAGFSAYETSVIAIVDGPITSSSGVRILPDLLISQTAKMPVFDTLLVAGAPHLSDCAIYPSLIAWLQRTAPKCRRFGSVCSGALVLAATGLLDNHRVTTHWAVADTLARQFPELMIEIDALHVRDRKVRTAAGVTAGLDLSLALVEEDLGREVAIKTACQLVMFFKRPGGQLQFSRSARASLSGRSALQDLQRWVLANLTADTSTVALAKRVGLSARHFVRVFQNEIGVTPAAWVEGVRIEAAKQRLEAGERPKQAASLSGFGDIDVFRRTFQRRVGITPSEYRRRYEVLDLD